MIVEFRRAKLASRITDKRTNFAKFQRVEVDLRTSAEIDSDVNGEKESEKDTRSAFNGRYRVSTSLSQIDIQYHVKSGYPDKAKRQ